MSVNTEEVKCPICGQKELFVKTEFSSGLTTYRVVCNDCAFEAETCALSPYSAFENFIEKEYRHAAEIKRKKKIDLLFCRIENARRAQETADKEMKDALSELKKVLQMNPANDEKITCNAAKLAKKYVQKGPEKAVGMKEEISKLIS